MSARTFYIAASSSPEGVSAARALASRLEGLGMTCAMRWWECLDAPESEWPLLAAKDIHAAVSADLFALLPRPQSAGAMVEVGARLGADRRVCVVGEWDEFFCEHPHVARFQSVDVLLAVLAVEGA